MVEDPSEITAMVRGKSVFYINVLHFTCCLKLPNDGLARQEVIEKVSGGANELIIRPFGRDEPHERPAQEFVEHGLMVNKPTARKTWSPSALASVSSMRPWILSGIPSKADFASAVEPFFPLIWGLIALCRLLLTCEPTSAGLFGCRSVSGAAASAGLLLRPVPAVVGPSGRGFR